VAYDGGNFGEAIFGVDRGMGSDRTPSPDSLLVNKCAGCQLPIANGHGNEKKYIEIDGELIEDVCEQCGLNLYECECDEEKHESILCELCKGMIEAETSHRLKSQEASMIKDWASGTKTSNGSTLS
jgi:hypothetical protein